MAQAAPPEWVCKRDGRVVPFEADKISRALFGATEALGRPDAFLARELADGVVHFLAAEGEERTPTTAEVGELVVKVVRELGQPALAEAFAACGRRRTSARAGPAAPAVVAAQQELVLRFSPSTPLARVLAGCTRAYTLGAVYSRDLVSAQQAGLLTLCGLEYPEGLEGCVLGRSGAPGADLAEAVAQARPLAGAFVVLDAPEYLAAAGGPDGAGAAAAMAAQLHKGLEPAGLGAVVNLNTAAPPPWADTLAAGPLFAGQPPGPPLEQLRNVAEQLLHDWLGAPGVRIDWHLGPRDFAPAEADHLQRLARLALEGAALGFVFDRPRRPVALAAGIDRQHPAVLLSVGLHLPLLAEQPGIEGDPERFLSKLGSLARLALSAAVQKRAYLRRLDQARPPPRTETPGVTSGFLLDRARMLVAPVGLEAVVSRFTQRGLGSGGSALELGRRIVGRLREVLRQDGRPAQMDGCLDGPWSFRLDRGPAGPAAGPPAEQVAGLTPWDATAPVKGQLRAGGVLHAACEGGTLALVVPQEPPATPAQAADWLRAAWQNTEVVRVRFLRGAPTLRQQTFAGASDALADRA
jgi:hypothetical protein